MYTVYVVSNVCYWAERKRVSPSETLTFVESAKTFFQFSIGIKP